MGQLAIVFGGPSPEHDISILTGLLSERVLRDAGQDVAPLYWTRTGDWVLCPARAEAKDFLEGPPAGSTRLEAVLGQGFQLPKKGLGGAKPLAIDAALNCCHGGAGEMGGLNSVFDQLGIPLTGGPGAAGRPRHGQARVRRGAAGQRRPDPAAGWRCPPPRSRPFDGPYIVKPRFGGSSIGIEVVEDLDTARALAKSSVQLRQGAVLEPFSKGAVDLNLGYSTHPSLRHVTAGEAARASRQRGHLLLRPEVPPDRRPGRGSPRAAGQGAGDRGQEGGQAGRGGARGDRASRGSVGSTSCWLARSSTSTRSTPSRGRWGSTSGPRRSRPPSCCSARSRRRRSSGLGAGAVRARRCAAGRRRDGRQARPDRAEPLAESRPAVVDSRDRTRSGTAKRVRTRLSTVVVGEAP